MQWYSSSSSSFICIRKNPIEKETKMHQWQKFGENPSTDTGDIAET